MTTVDPRPPAAEYPVSTWVAAKDIGYVPSLGYRLRWGAKPGEGIRLYWEARFASPTSRYHYLRRWELVPESDRQSTLVAAVQVGLPVAQVLADVERWQRTAQLKGKKR